MTSSLVGSEMCIRDRQVPMAMARWPGKAGTQEEERESHKDYSQLSLMSTSAKVVQTAGKHVLDK
eukprot:4906648-Prorocentrum_lima.AAC.1